MKNKNKMVYKDYEKNMNVLLDSTVEAWRKQNKTEIKELEKEIDKQVMNNPVFDEEYKRTLLDNVNKEAEKYKNFNNFLKMI
ncbi:MAG: hypothetical protein IKP65_08820 [Alphaproteobacteria bacterium]|nr:hypothetical protein [Alphaproteobacteria bacterium]